MKPAPFQYIRASSVDDALAGMAGHGDDAKALAGGQSLIALMNLRLVRPGRALTRQSGGELFEAVARFCPIMAEAIRFVAHWPIRRAACARVGNRGCAQAARGQYRRAADHTDEAPRHDPRGSTTQGLAARLAGLIVS